MDTRLGIWNCISLLCCFIKRQSGGGWKAWLGCGTLPYKVKQQEHSRGTKKQPKKEETIIMWGEKWKRQHLSLGVSFCIERGGGCKFKGIKHKAQKGGEKFCTEDIVMNVLLLLGPHICVEIPISNGVESLAWEETQFRFYDSICITNRPAPASRGSFERYVHFYKRLSGR